MKMKKYIKPNMEVNTIEMEEMIAASEVTGTDGIGDLGMGGNDYSGPADTKDRNNWGGLLW